MKFILQMIRDCWLAGMDIDEMTEYMKDVCARPETIRIVGADAEFNSLDDKAVVRNVLYHFNQLEAKIKLPAHLVK